MLIAHNTVVDLCSTFCPAMLLYTPIISRSLVARALPQQHQIPCPVSGHFCQGTTPVLLKFSRDDDAAEHESHVWQQLCSGGTPPHLAGPVTLLNLQNEWTGKGKKALQMPIYPATLQPRLTPCEALKIGIDIKTGLQHMHSHKLRCQGTQHVH